MSANILLYAELLISRCIIYSYGYRADLVIRTDLTLEESGVRNGDYITVLNMG